MTKAAELAKMGEVLTNSQIGGRRNIVINGAMKVAQRSDGVTGIGASGGYFTVDRYKTIISGTSGRFTMSQETITDLAGFGNALKINCTTADTSVASGEYYILSQLFEGQDVQQLKKGTSDAEKVTVSFYVKGNASATYSLELEDTDNGRRNSQTFAVTTSWNRVSLTFNGDTTGTLNNDNANSFNINFWLHAGSDFTGGTFSNNSWGTGTNTRASSSQTSIFDSTDRTFFLTGVQMEGGSQATPFEHRSYGEERQLCYRYYYRTPDSVAGGHGANETFPCVGNMDGTQTGAFMFIFPVPMRAAPTAIEQSGTSSDYSIRVTSDSNGSTGPTAGGFTSEKALVNLISNSASFTSGDGAFMRMEDTDAFIAFSADLQERLVKTYKVDYTLEDGTQMYGKVDNDDKIRLHATDKNPDFQEWLKANKDNLPSDIQAKVNDGSLVIESK